MTESSNGHAPREIADSRRRNAYAEILSDNVPREIADFDFATDPYGNMLPGISNINAARVVGEGVAAGSRGHKLVMAVSALLVLSMIVVPVIVAVTSVAGAR